MSEPNREDLTDKAHLYRGLSQHPSAHADPPASVVGPTGLREEPGSTPAPSGAGTGSVRAPRAELSYDTVSPRFRRGGGGKVLLGTAALIGAAIAYFLLPKFGLGPGILPTGGIVSSNPPTGIPASQPATAPYAASEPASIPSAAPLHLTIQDETYHVGPATGREVALDEALNLAKNAKPGSPVVIDLNDSSRAMAEERLKAAFDQQQIPIIWTRDGKPSSGDLPAPGKAPGS